MVQALLVTGGVFVREMHALDRGDIAAHSLYRTSFTCCCTDFNFCSAPGLAAYYLLQYYYSLFLHPRVWSHQDPNSIGRVLYYMYARISMDGCVTT